MAIISVTGSSMRASSGTPLSTIAFSAGLKSASRVPVLPAVATSEADLSVEASSASWAKGSFLACSILRPKTNPIPTVTHMNNANAIKSRRLVTINTPPPHLSSLSQALILVPCCPQDSVKAPYHMLCACKEPYSLSESFSQSPGHPTPIIALATSK